MSRTLQAIGLSQRRARGAATGSADPYRLGLELVATGALGKAIECFETALSTATTPERHANILLQLGNCAQKLGQIDLSIEFYHRTLSVEPERVEAIVPLSTLYTEKKRHHDAQNLLKEKIKVCKNTAPLWLALGNATREAGDLDAAEAFIREALAQKPNYALALGALGDLLSDKGQTEDALEAYSKAIKKDSKLDRVRYHRGLLKLSVGNLKEGWRDFDYRFSSLGRDIEYCHGLRKWDGHDLRGRTLLVTAEQGIGDQILFASAFPDVLADAETSGGAVLIECEARLVPLFQRSFPTARVFPMQAVFGEGRHRIEYEWLRGIDRVTYHIPMGSLGRLYRNDVADMPNPHHYLKADPEQAVHWHNAAEDNGRPERIGICWRSGDTSGARSLQFAPREHWAHFLRSVDAELVSLQYDATEEEVHSLSALCGRDIAVPAGLDQKNDLDGTAALINTLGAVVSAPTSVAALSAALGVPTFKILRDRSWTAFGQTYEPFAPACRLIKGERAGDWDSTFKAALEELEGLGR